MKQFLQSIAIITGMFAASLNSASACNPMSADCLGGWAYVDGDI